jgi:hypothetical protein
LWRQLGLRPQQGFDGAALVRGPVSLVGEALVERVGSCIGAQLIGELSTRSEEFRALWAAHNVRLHRSGLKHFHHPVIGRMDLMFEAMALEADEGLTLTATPPSPAALARCAQAPSQLGRDHPS